MEELKPIYCEDGALDLLIEYVESSSIILKVYLCKKYSIKNIKHSLFNSIRPAILATIALEISL